MDKASKIEELQNRIKEIKEEFLTLDELRPGSLGKQFNVCGNPRCRCKDKENPQKHGPYYQLSYTWNGRSTSEFIREIDVEATENHMANYQKFMSLRHEWIECSIQLAKIRKQK